MGKVTLSERGLMKTACEAAREAVKEWKAKNPSQSVMRFDVLPKCLFDYGCGKGETDLYVGEFRPGDDPHLQFQNLPIRSTRFTDIERDRQKVDPTSVRRSAEAFIKAKGGGRLGVVFNASTGKITHVSPNSGAAKAGIRKGDIFHRISGELVKEASKDNGLCLGRRGDDLLVNGSGLVPGEGRGSFSDKYFLPKGFRIPASGIIVKGIEAAVTNGKMKITIKKYRPGQYSFPDLVFGKVGSVARVTIIRDGKEIELKVVRGR